MAFNKLKKLFTSEFQYNKEIIKDLVGRFIVGESEEEDLKLWREAILRIYESDFLSKEEKSQLLLRINDIYDKYLLKHYVEDMKEYKFLFQFVDGSLKIKNDK